MQQRRRWGARLGIGVALIVATAITVTGTAASAAHRGDLPGFGPGRDYHPSIDPHDFAADVDNPWFPLTPGTTLVYSGEKGGAHARELVTTLARTKLIDGVRTRVVFDQLFLDGRLAERTYDYYAQDDDDNVWYFGEDTVALDDNGNLTDTEGSFRAGVDGAEPGVFMPAHPQIGRRFRQEWYAGQAEDQFRVVERNANVSVPFGSFHRALRTEETTDLEPGVVDDKFYVRHVGEVSEAAVQGGTERLELVRIQTAR
jgi:hypothetical protein